MQVCSASARANAWKTYPVWGDALHPPPPPEVHSTAWHASSRPLSRPITQAALPAVLPSAYPEPDPMDPSSPYAVIQSSSFYVCSTRAACRRRPRAQSLVPGMSRHVQACPGASRHSWPGMPGRLFAVLSSKQRPPHAQRLTVRPAKQLMQPLRSMYSSSPGLISMTITVVSSPIFFSLRSCR